MNVDAQAETVDPFFFPEFSISAGGSSTANLSLSVIADPGDFNAQFVGGSVTLFSGTGLSQTFSIASGLNSEDFFASFNYPTAGNFNPSYSYSATIGEQFTAIVQTGTQEVQIGTQEVSCGFLCFTFVPIFAFEPVFGPVTENTSFGATGSDFTSLEVDPAATPLPAALPLFAGGLSALGLLARRRKRKTAFAV